MINEDGKVIFDATEQVEVDRIVGERLARAKLEKPADYEDLQEINKLLEEFDYAGMTANEKKVALKELSEKYKSEKQLTDLQEQAKEQGTSPELLKKIETLEAEIKELTGERQAQKQAEIDKQKAEATAKQELEEFEEKHKDVDWKELLKNPKFVKYADKRAGTLTDLYDSYIEFVGETEAEALVKVVSKENRSTSSGKDNSTDGNNYNLTEHQKELAKENGMTYKRYAELLPKK